MRRTKRIVCAMMMAFMMAMAAGCANSSGSLGKVKFGIFNIVAVEGEGITWDNRMRSPVAVTEMPADIDPGNPATR